MSAPPYSSFPALEYVSKESQLIHYNTPPLSGYPGCPHGQGYSSNSNHFQLPLSQVNDAPPSYSEVNPLVLMSPPTPPQRSTGVVVVQQPSEPVFYTSTAAQPLVSDHYLTLSIILTIFCIFCFTWYGLCCTIPALVFSLMA